jgi:hypothetical protein
MVEFFQDLVNNTSSSVRVKMIVTSRPENLFRDYFGNNDGFKVDKCTCEDIDKFIHGELGRKLLSKHQSPFLRAQPSDSGTLIRSAQQSARSSNSVESGGTLTPEKLMVQIAENASGVFLWVRLVGKELIKEWSRNPLMAYMTKKLNEFPKELRELYEYILKRVPLENRLESYIMMKLVLRSKRPLSALELVIMASFIKRAEPPRQRFRWKSDFPTKR